MNLFQPIFFIFNPSKRKVFRIENGKIMEHWDYAEKMKTN